MLLIVIMESQLQNNTGVTQEMFMDGYNIAVERNPGTPPTHDYEFGIGLFITLSF